MSSPEALVTVRRSAITLTAAALLLCLMLPSTINTQLESALEIPLTSAQRSPKVAKFLHITDMHVDPYYVVGSKAGSSCHTLAKKPKDSSKSAGPLGHRACDSPLPLVKATLKWIKDHHADEVDFVVWTGDNARHDNDNSLRRTRQEIYDVNQNIASLMYNTFSHMAQANKAIPIIPTFGNNDVYPHNILYGGSKGRKVFKKFLTIWEPFIPSDQHETFLKGGYFSVNVIPDRLKVVSLNSMYFYNSNAAVDSCRKKSSPGYKQLEWLKSELKQAQQKGIKIIVIGHVPPSRKAYYKSCLRQYSDLALQYDAIISAHLYGHQNMDHFLILGDEYTVKNEEVGGEMDNEMGQMDDDVAIKRNIRKYLKALRESYRSLDYVNDDKARHAVINVSPSVIPEMNPTFRLIRYDGSEKRSSFGTLLGYTQWFSNLTYWNQHQQDRQAKPVFNLQENTGHFDLHNGKSGADDNTDIPYLEYEAEYDTVDYNMADLSTDSWLYLARNLSGEEAESEALWQVYTSRMFVQSKDAKELASLG